jgi:hypothetical protein
MGAKGNLGVGGGRTETGGDEVEEELARTVGEVAMMA